MASRLTVRDLFYDPEFFALSPQARTLVYQQVARDDQEFQALSPQAKIMLYQKLLSASAPLKPEVPEMPKQVRPSMAQPRPEDLLPTPAQIPEPPSVPQMPIQPRPSMAQVSPVDVLPMPAQIPEPGAVATQPAPIPTPPAGAVPQQQPQMPLTAQKPQQPRFDAIPVADTLNLIVPLDDAGNPLVRTALLQDTTTGTVMPVNDPQAVVKAYQARALEERAKARQKEVDQATYWQQVKDAFVRGSKQMLATDAGVIQMLGEQPAVNPAELMARAQAEHPTPTSQKEWQRRQLEKALAEAKENPEVLRILTQLGGYIPVLGPIIASIEGAGGVKSFIENPREASLALVEQLPQTIIDQVLGLIGGAAVQSALKPAATIAGTQSKIKKALQTAAPAAGYGFASAVPESLQEAGDVVINAAPEEKRETVRQAWGTFLGNLALLTGSNTLQAVGIIAPDVFLKAAGNAAKLARINKLTERIAQNKKMAAILDSVPARALEHNLKTAFLIAAESGVEGAEEYLQEVIKQVATGGSLFAPEPQQSAERILAGEAGKHLGILFGAASGLHYASGKGRGPGALPKGTEGVTLGPGGAHESADAGVVGEGGPGATGGGASGAVPVSQEGQDSGQVGEGPGGVGVGNVPPTDQQWGSAGPGVGAGAGGGDTGGTAAGGAGSGVGVPGTTGEGSGTDVTGTGRGDGKEPARVFEERRNTLNRGLRDRVYPYALEHHKDDLEGPGGRGIVDQKFPWIGNSFAEQLSEEANPDWHSVAFDVRGFKDINTEYGYEAADSILDVIAQIAQAAAREVEPDATIFRYGGDEFILHVPSNGDKVAKAIEGALPSDVTIIADLPGLGQRGIKLRGVRTAFSTVTGGKGERRASVLKALEERSKSEGSFRGKGTATVTGASATSGPDGRSQPEGGHDEGDRAAPTSVESRAEGVPVEDSDKDTETHGGKLPRKVNPDKQLKPSRSITQLRSTALGDYFDTLKEGVPVSSGLAATATYSIQKSAEHLHESTAEQDREYGVYKRGDDKWVGVFVGKDSTAKKPAITIAQTQEQFRDKLKDLDPNSKIASLLRELDELARFPEDMQPLVPVGVFFKGLESYLVFHDGTIISASFHKGQRGFSRAPFLVTTKSGEKYVVYKGYEKRNDGRIWYYPGGISAAVPVVTTVEAPASIRQLLSDIAERGIDDAYLQKFGYVTKPLQIPKQAEGEGKVAAETKEPTDEDEWESPDDVREDSEGKTPTDTDTDEGKGISPTPGKRPGEELREEPAEEPRKEPAKEPEREPREEPAREEPAKEPDKETRKKKEEPTPEPDEDEDTTETTEEEPGADLEDEYEFPGSETAKINESRTRPSLADNVEAVLVAERLAKEGRAPTEEEQKKLAAFRGWGVLEKVFLPDSQLDSETLELKKKLLDALGEEGFERAKQTAINSHYTDPAVAFAIWEALKAVGFSGGTVLEPAVGSGVFIGTLDKETRRDTRVTAVDMDPAAVRIVKSLYRRTVRRLFNKRFELVNLRDNSYDLAITNVPFANVSVNYVRKNKIVARLRLHDYFILRMIDAIKPGGFAVVITSRFTLDKMNDEARRLMYEKADLVSAIRLPSETFSHYSGTNVVTDILVFRKRKPDEPRGDSTWLETVPVVFADDQKFDIIHEDRINKYFVTRPSTDDLLGPREPIDRSQIGAYRPWHWRLRKSDETKMKHLQKLQEQGTFVVQLGYSERGVRRDRDYIPDVFGALAIGPGLYSDKELIVTPSSNSMHDSNNMASLTSRIRLKLEEMLKGKYNPEDVQESESDTTTPAVPEWVADGSTNTTLLFDDIYIGDDGSIYRVEIGADNTPRLIKDKMLNDNKELVIAAYKARQALMRVMDLDALPGSENTEQSAEARKELAKAYDALKEKLGKKKPLSSPDLTKVLGNGPARWSLTAMEVEEKDDKGNVISFRKSPIFERPIITRAAVLQPSTIADLPKVSMALHATYDIQFMAKLARDLGLPGFNGLTQKQAEKVIRKYLLDNRLAFVDPETNLIVPDVVYLSGNVRKKLKRAKEAAKTDKTFEANVEALEQALPPEIKLVDNDDVSVTIGSSFIHQAIAEKLTLALLSLMGNTDHDAKNGARILKSAVELAQRYLSGELTEDSEELSRTQGAIAQMLSGQYRANLAGMVSSDLAQRLTNFTDREDAFDVLNRAVEAALNSTDPAPRPRRDPQTGAQVIPPEEYAKAAKAKELADALNYSLRTVILSSQAKLIDPLINYLEDRFNETLNGWRPLQPNVEHFKDQQTGEYFVAGLDKSKIKPRYYQIKAVWKLILGGLRGMIAHEVGLGKTFTLAATALEAKRLGLVKKPVIAVPKSQIVQFTDAVRQYFPNARVLSSASVKDAKTRRQFYSMIVSTEADVIIMTHEQLTYMQPSERALREIYQSEIIELTNTLEEIQRSRSGHERDILTTRQINEITRQIARLQSELDAALRHAKKETGVPFDNTGIDAIFVDEAHYFKSLPVVTSLRNIPGIPAQRSTRATRLLALIKTIELTTGTRRVVLATGTPISNTLPEAYIMAKYISPEVLDSAGVGRFDRWLAEFGHIYAEPERKATGEIDIKTRLRSFRNAGRFRQILDSWWDVELGEDHEDLLKRPRKIQHVVDVEPVKAQLAVVKWLAHRARQLRRRGGNAPATGGQDNHLVIFTHGRKSAVDPRLLVKTPAPHIAGNRLEAIADNVARIYHETKATHKQPKAQVIFSDYGIYEVEGSGFNIYDKLVEMLVDRGVPREEIAVFRSSLSPKKRMALVDGINSGKYNIAIGSTATVGTGTNIQKRLFAAHHVDPLWVPAHMEQREGRIWRFGNENNEIHIYYYVTKRTFDEIMYATLNRKAQFIRQFLRGDISDTEHSADAEETITYEDIASIASGDRRVYELIKARNRASDLTSIISGLQASLRNLEISITNAARLYKRKLNASQVLSLISQNLASRHPATITFLFPDVTFTKKTYQVPSESGKGFETKTTLSPRFTSTAISGTSLFWSDAVAEDHSASLSDLVSEFLGGAAKTVRLDDTEALVGYWKRMMQLSSAWAKKSEIEVMIEGGPQTEVPRGDYLPIAVIGDVLLVAERDKVTSSFRIVPVLITDDLVPNLRKTFVTYMRNNTNFVERLGTLRSHKVLFNALPDALSRLIAYVFDNKEYSVLDLSDETYSYDTQLNKVFGILPNEAMHDFGVKSFDEIVLETLKNADADANRAKEHMERSQTAYNNRSSEIEKKEQERQEVEQKIKELEQQVSDDISMSTADEEEIQIIKFIEENIASDIEIPTYDVIDAAIEAAEEDDAGAEDKDDTPEARARIIKRDSPSRALVLSLAGNIYTGPDEKRRDESLAVTTDEIIGFIENRIGVPIRRGRSKPRRRGMVAAGLFYIKERFIRLRVANDIDTVLHEVGHAAEDLLFDNDFVGKVTSDPAETAKITEELAAFCDKALGEGTYRDEEKKDEGFAEMVRLWLTGANDVLESDIPTTYAAFRRYLRENATKRIVARFYTLRELIAAWRRQGAFARAEAQLSLRGPAFREKILAAFRMLSDGETRQLLKDYFTRLVGDRYVRLRTFMAWINELREEAGKKPLVGAANPYHIARAFSKNAAGIARAWVSDGIEDPFSGKKLFPSIREIVQLAYQTLQSKEADIRRLFYDIIVHNYAKYTLERYAKADTPQAAKHTGLSPEDAETIIRELQGKYGADGYAVLDKASQEITGWNHAVIDWLMMVGAMSQKTADLIKASAMYYIPLHRVMREFAEYELKPVVGGGQRTVGASPVRRMKGSFRPAIDPFEAMYRQTEKFIAIGIKAAWARALFEAGADIKGIGRWFAKKDPKMTKYTFTVKQIAGQLNDLLKDIGAAELPDDVMDELLTFWGQNVEGTLKEQRTFMVVKDGKPHFYEIIDPELWKVLTDSDIEQLPKWIAALLKPFQATARLVRLGATGLKPRFALITNPIRDTWESLMGTKGTSGGHLLKVWRPFINALLSRESLPEEMWRKLGGQLTTLMGLDRTAIKALRDEILAEASGTQWQKIKTLVLHPIDTLRGVLGFTESINRVTEFDRVYNDAKKAGYSEEDARILALIAAKELTVDFTRAGTIGWFLNSIIPFLNPALQDISRVRRLFRTRPRTTLIRGFMYITLPVTVLWLMNSDEEWWNELPYWRRILFVHIPLYRKGKEEPEAVIALPLPFTFGVIFGAIPLMMLELQKGRRERMKDYLKTALSAVMPPVGTPLISVAYQLAKNETWYGKPIVPQALEKINPEAQYFKHTPELYKFLGGLFDVSPLKIQYAFEQLTGGLIKDIDFFFRKEIREEADIPVVGALFERSERLGETYFRLKAERDLLEQIAATIERLRIHGDYEAAYKLAMDNAEELGIHQSPMIRKAVLASIRAKGGVPRKFFRRLRALDKAVDELGQMIRQERSLKEVTKKSIEVKRQLDAKFASMRDIADEQMLYD